MCWGKIMISTIKEFLILPVKITAKKEVSHVALLTQECPFKIVKNLSEKRTHLTTKYTCKISKTLNQVHLMNKITFKAKRKTTHWNNHQNYKNHSNNKKKIRERYNVRNKNIVNSWLIVYNSFIKKLQI